MQFAFRSDQGSPVRNEDRCLANEELGFFLVCDGLSVKDGGDEAADIAGEILLAWANEHQALLDQVKNTGGKNEKLTLEGAVAEAVHGASRAIFQRAAQNPALQGMCTSLDLVLLLGHHALISHVGAGRVYVVRNGEAHLLTEDHTQAAYLRRLGKLSNLTPQQVAVYARRLTRAVGYQETAAADTLIVELEPNDRFVVMTDGVWQTLGDTTVFALAARKLPPADLLEQIQAAVGETGAKDNFTTLILDPEAQAAPVQAGADQKLKMLGKVPVFEYLSYQELVKVLSVGDLVKVGAGQVICEEGARGGEMMLIISGSAEVKKGNKRLRILGKGDVFGEMSMLDSSPRSATVVASSASSLLAFPQEALFNLFKEDQGLSVKFLWGVSMELNRRLRSVSNQLVGQPENAGAPTDSKGPLPFQRSL